MGIWGAKGVSGPTSLISSVKNYDGCTDAYSVAILLDG